MDNTNNTNAIVMMDSNNNITTLSLKEKIANAARTWSKPTPKRKGKVSKFEQHLDTIRYLRSCRHMSYLQIHDFFNANGVPCSYPNLMHFVHVKNIGDIRAKKRKTKEAVA